MTIDQLLQLDGVPQMWGQPLYPGGVAMPLESITWTDGETLHFKWRKRLDAVVNRKASPDKADEQLLVNWVIYYLHAPIWMMNPFATAPLRALLKKDLVNMPLNDLIWECIAIGIDPL